MGESKLSTARMQVAEAMEQGLPWHEAAKRAGRETQSIDGPSAPPAGASRGRTSVVRGQTWTPIKLRGEVRQWLEQVCRQAPSPPSHEIQTQPAQQFSQEAQCQPNQPSSHHIRSQQCAAKCEKK